MNTGSLVLPCLGLGLILASSVTALFGLQDPDVVRCRRLEIGSSESAISMVLEDKGGVPSIRLKDRSFVSDNRGWSIEITASRLGGTVVRMKDPADEGDALIEFRLGRSPQAPLIQIVGDRGDKRLELRGYRVPGGDPSVRIVDDEGTVLLSD